MLRGRGEREEEQEGEALPKMHVGGERERGRGAKPCCREKFSFQLQAHGERKEEKVSRVIVLSVVRQTHGLGGGRESIYHLLE